MNSKAINGLSVTCAVVLHVAVVGVLLATWDDDHAEAAQLMDERLYIAAHVVAENPHKARERAEARRRAERDARRNKPPRLPPADTPALPTKPPEVEPPRPDPTPPEIVETSQPELAPERPAAQSEEERLQMEQILREEQEYRLAVTDDEKAQAYAAQIKRDIAENWASPPSARNGMQALLVVFLVPTGEVVNVQLEETSGNDAFDRSAILAVRKAGRFDVPTDSRQFERNFRKFTVLFRPENLRL